MYAATNKFPGYYVNSEPHAHRHMLSWLEIRYVL